jgi:hypothetical protein
MAFQSNSMHRSFLTVPASVFWTTGGIMGLSLLLIALESLFTTKTIASGKRSQIIGNVERLPNVMLSIPRAVKTSGMGCAGLSLARRSHHEFAYMVSQLG